MAIVLLSAVPTIMRRGRVAVPFSLTADEAEAIHALSDEYPAVRIMSVSRDGSENAEKAVAKLRNRAGVLNKNAASDTFHFGAFSYVEEDGETRVGLNVITGPMQVRQRRSVETRKSNKSK